MAHAVAGLVPFAGILAEPLSATEFRPRTLWPASTPWCSSAVGSCKRRSPILYSEPSIAAVRLRAKGHGPLAVRAGRALAAAFLHALDGTRAASSCAPGGVVRSPLPRRMRDRHRTL